MSGEGPITLLHPPRVTGGGSAAALDDADLIALYSPADRTVPFVRVNFVSSVDGSASAAGLTSKLGGPADLRVFDLLRQLCDVVVVAAGTVRSEGYGAMRLADEAAAWRVAAGLPAHPVFAIVSGSLDLDPNSDVFVQAPVRPLVVTAESGDPERRRALEQVADVISCGETTVEPARLVRALVDHGLPQIHCEGGPSLLGALIEADVLHALCLTISPVLEGGAGGRITRAAPGSAPIKLRDLHLDHVLLAAGMLLTQYSRDRG